jgi:putative membrane protein
MQKNQRIHPLLAMALAAAVCVSTPAQAAAQQAVTPSVGAPATEPAPGATVKLSSADREALADLAMANMAEIHSAQIALSKSQNANVKAFAQRMIDDHGKVHAEVLALAKAKGVELPAELNVKYKTKSALLRFLSGDIFDRTYIKQSGRADHRDTNQKLRDNLDDLNDPDIKALVNKTRPVVEQHLLMAEEMIAITARNATGTAGTPGTDTSTATGQEPIPNKK